MYDSDPAAVEDWWHAIAEQCRTEGIDDVPSEPTWPGELDAHWRDPRLLLSQTCGYPLVTRLRDAVQVVGAFRYDVPGCDGIDYRSELIVRSDDPGHSLIDLEDRVVAVNDLASQSGCNALLTMLALSSGDASAEPNSFFRDWRVTGSHRMSIETVRNGRADIAAIDCVTLAGLRRDRPAIFDGLRIIGSTSRSPGLPLVTSLSTPPSDLAALRRALHAACVDPRWATLRGRLFIAGFETADAATWQPIAASLKATVSSA